MFVNPFWLGVLVTILVEVVAVIVIGLTHPRDDREEASHGTEKENR